MKPSELQGITLKQIRVALPVQSKGAEYALDDLIIFCRELNADRFHLIPLVALISHFRRTNRSERDHISAKVKLEGLTMLLEEGLLKKTSKYRLRFTPELKAMLVRAQTTTVTPQKVELSKESKSMTATSSG